MIPELDLQEIADSTELPVPEIDLLDKQEQKLITLCTYAVIQPEILGLSECTHRAVSACIATELQPHQDLDELRTELDREGVYGQIVILDSRPFLVVFGFNRWRDVDEPLNCKEPGIPWEQEPHQLRWYEDTIVRPEDVDLACPKRSLQLQCHVRHAEDDALTQFLDLGVHAADHSFMVCTWVPCPSCLNLLLSNKNVFGNSRVISICGAMNDAEDSADALEIRRMFDAEQLSAFHGPYLTVPKKPGYGWILCDMEQLQQSLDQIGVSRPGWGGIEAKIHYMIRKILRHTGRRNVGTKSF